MTKFLDLYYKYSIVFDLFLCLAVCTSLKVIEFKFGDLTNYNNYDRTLCSDLGSIGLTVSGFLLTISTILISFKTSILYENTELKNSSSSFKIFINSPLYFDAVSFLNKSVVVLVLLSIFNYLLKIMISSDDNYILYYANLCSVIVIMTTFIRCLYVLKLIIKMQR